MNDFWVPMRARVRRASIVLDGEVRGPAEIEFPDLSERLTGM